MGSEPDVSGERERMIESVRHYFVREAPDVAAAYIFGSVGRGDDRSGSDLDVAILLRNAPPAELSAIPTTMETDLARLTARSVDILVLNRAPVDVAKRVLRDGVLVVDRDPSRRIAFEVRVRNEYWDLLPILRRYRRQEVASR